MRRHIYSKYRAASLNLVFERMKERKGGREGRKRSEEKKRKRLGSQWRAEEDKERKSRPSIVVA